MKTMKKKSFEKVVAVFQYNFFLIVYFVETLKHLILIQSRDILTVIFVLFLLNFTMSNN